MKNNLLNLLTQNGRTIRKVIVFLIPIIVSFYYFYLFLTLGLYERKPENIPHYLYEIIYFLASLYGIFLIVLVSLLILIILRYIIIVSYISFVEWKKPNTVFIEFIKKEIENL